MPKQFSPCQLAERSLQTKYRHKIWSPFVKALKDYQLLQKGDRVAVCISGGKDSMLLAKLMQMLKRISDFEFELEFLVMNPGYNQQNLQKIIDNSALLQIPITIFESDIFEAVDNMSAPCYLCARMRRGFLYSKAKELGCNKIALGHHFSDVIETTLMGMLYGAQFQAMMPRIKSKNFEGMELIRPLFCVHEDSIISWKNHNSLEFIQCACRFTQSLAVQDVKTASKRSETKELIRSLKKNIKDVEQRIFKSIHMVNLDTVIGYKQGGIEHSFLERFDKNLLDDNADF